MVVNSTLGLATVGWSLKTLNPSLDHHALYFGIIVFFIGILLYEVEKMRVSEREPRDFRTRGRGKDEDGEDEVDEDEWFESC